MGLYKKGDFGIFPANQLRGLPVHHQVVMAWLIFHTNQSGKCFPSLKTLTEETSVKKTKLTEVLSDLEKWQLIEREQRFGNKGQASTMYRVRNTDPVREADTPCSSDGHTPVREADTNQKKEEPKEDNHKQPPPNGSDQKQSAVNPVRTKRDCAAGMDDANVSQERERKTPAQKGYEPRVDCTWPEVQVGKYYFTNDWELARAISEWLIRKTSDALSRKLIAKPDPRPIIKLFKAGATPRDVSAAVKWLNGPNLESDFRIDVQSSDALYRKWDKIQAAIERTKPKVASEDLELRKKYGGAA